MKIGREIFAAVALCSLLFNFPALVGIARQTLAPGGDFTRDLARLVRDALPEGGSVCLVSSDDSREASVETAMRQAVAWEVAPAPVPQGGAAECGRLADAVLCPSCATGDIAWLANPGSGFTKVGEAMGRELWVREGDASARRPSADVSLRTELVGLLPVAIVVVSGLLVGGTPGMLLAVVAHSLLAMAVALGGISFSRPLAWGIVPLAVACAGFVRRGVPRDGVRRQVSPSATICACLIFAVVSGLALAHRFVPPYGLAVTGGKAKAWFLAQGAHPSFFADAVWRVFEPAYPPGCAAQVLGCYAAAGRCGDFATQLLTCVFLALLAAAALAQMHGAWRKVWLAALFLAPASLMAAGQFYPEPLMALCVLVGWLCVGEGKSVPLGWFLLGMSGWFKNEGLVFLLAAWVAWRLADCRRADVRDLLLGAALPVAWHIGCRATGAHLNGYAAPGQISALRGARAAAEVLRRAFLRPWETVFAYPAAAAAAVWIRRRGESLPRSFRAALVFAVLSLLSFCAIYACGDAATDLQWHLRTSLPRLLLTPALILACETAWLGETFGD